MKNKVFSVKKCLRFPGTLLIVALSLTVLLLYFYNYQPSRRSLMLLAFFSLLASFGLWAMSCRLFTRKQALNDILAARNLELEKVRVNLEKQVLERTAELEARNQELQQKIAERQLLQDAQRISLEEWQRTFDAITQPVLILDLERVVVKENAAALLMLSQDGSPLSGLSCDQIFSDGEARCTFCPLDTLSEPGKAQSHIHTIERHQCSKILQVVCSPIFDGTDRIGFILTVQDITQQNALERRLVHVQKMEAIATLAGGIAHDFNNILGAILGNVELLLYRLARESGESSGIASKVMGAAELQEHLEAIKAAGVRAKDLVSQLLVFSRQTGAQRRQISLTPVIKETVKFLRASLPATIDFQAHINQQSCKVHADPTQVHQMLMDLVTNASQAIAHEKGHIEVTLTDMVIGAMERHRYPNLPPGTYAALAVADNGHGMTREVMARIFDPFFSTKPLGESTGMGLSVLHGLVESNEGYVDVQSTPGQGSVFTLFFPCVQHEVAQNMESVVSIPRGSGAILFVDDEQEIVTMRSRMLEFLGYTVLATTQPEEALRLFAQDPTSIDLLITDQTMPKMTGLELANAVHLTKKNLPIILCSGYSEAITSEEAASSGINYFLPKPLDMRLLATTIREVLKKKTS